jgi:hypothetical protein
MRALSTSELLGAWERVRGAAPVGRAVALLAAARDDLPTAAIEALPLGVRDACLLALREQWFGRFAESVTRCPRCSELLEMQLDVASLQIAPSAPPDEPLVADVEGVRITFRLPCSADIVAAGSAPNESGTDVVLHRCILAASRDGEPVRAADLPSQVIEHVVARMEQADPMASLELDLTCAGCGHAWAARLDVAGFLWDEVETWAQRALDDVHALASAYGWSEHDILALTPARRQLYLERVVA